VLVVTVLERASSSFWIGASSFGGSSSFLDLVLHLLLGAFAWPLVLLHRCSTPPEIQSQLDHLPILLLLLHRLHRISLLHHTQLKPVHPRAHHHYQLLHLPARLRFSVLLLVVDRVSSLFSLFFLPPPLLPLHFSSRVTRNLVQSDSLRCVVRSKPPKNLTVQNR